MAILSRAIKDTLVKRVFYKGIEVSELKKKDYLFKSIEKIKKAKKKQKDKGN